MPRNERRRPRRVADLLDEHGQCRLASVVEANVDHEPVLIEALTVEAEPERLADRTRCPVGCDEPRAGQRRAGHQHGLDPGRRLRHRRHLVTEHEPHAGGDCAFAQEGLELGLVVADHRWKAEAGHEALGELEADDPRAGDVDELGTGECTGDLGETLAGAGQREGPLDLVVHDDRSRQVVDLGRPFDDGDLETPRRRRPWPRRRRPAHRRRRPRCEVISPLHATVDHRADAVDGRGDHVARREEPS